MQWFGILVLASIALLYMNYRKLFGVQSEEQEGNRYNYLLVMLSLVILGEFFSQLFLFLNYNYIDRTGHTSILYIIVYMISIINTQNIISFLFVARVWGCTIFIHEVEGNIY